MERKSLKCVKCGIPYKERRVVKTVYGSSLCMKCEVIWNVIGNFLNQLTKEAEELNRIVSINADAFSIKRRFKERD